MGQRYLRTAIVRATISCDWLRLKLHQLSAARLRQEFLRRRSVVVISWRLQQCLVKCGCTILYVDLRPRSIWQVYRKERYSLLSCGWCDASHG